VPSGVGIEGRDAHQAVDTALCFEEAVRERTVELDGGAFDAGAFSVLEVELGNGPPLFFPVHAVHAQEHLGPVLTFCSTGAGIDLHDGGQFVFGLVKGTLELCLFDLTEGLFVGFAGLFFGGLAGFPEVEEYGKVFNGRLYRFIELDPVLVELDVFENFRRSFVVVPETGAQRQLSFFVDLILTVVDVKETSSGRLRGPS